MATRNIIKDGDEALKKVCRPVTAFDGRLHELLDDMRETLSAANGLGLAAPQVGILRRAVLVINEKSEVLELVNPQIVSAEGEQEGFEGCLSVPGLYGWVKRPYKVKIKAQDRFGKEFEMEDVGITARCFCHEISHLDGHLFTELAQDGRLYTEEEIDAMQEEQEAKEKPRRKKRRGGR